jgi:hypothetical protein
MNSKITKREHVPPLVVRAWQYTPSGIFVATTGHHQPAPAKDTAQAVPPVVGRPARQSHDPGAQLAQLVALSEPALLRGKSEAREVLTAAI